MSAPPRPRLARLLLRCLPLGERRDDVESDVLELFEVRRRERGGPYAYWRLLGDLASVARPAGASVSRRSPRVPGGRSAAIMSWLLDLRYSLRLFRKHPALLATTVGGLALTIAIGTGVFTILNATVIRPYGMDHPESVVRVQMTFTRGLSTSWPYHAFVSLREQAPEIELAASMQEDVAFSEVAGDAAARPESVMFLSGEYLTLLGGRAVVGRTLLSSDNEPGAAPVVVLNHHFWTTRLNGDPSIAGKTLWLSGRPVTVAGVIDRSFTGPVDAPPVLWAPISTYGSIYPSRPIDRASTAQVVVVARARACTERTAVERRLSAITAVLPGIGVRSESGVTPASGVRLDGAASPMDGPDSTEELAVVSVILLAVGLVLALACANVANLLLAGASARSREIALRLALGASRRRIARQLLGESLLLALTAGVAGYVLSLRFVPVVTRSLGLPDNWDLRPDMTVALFTAAISLFCGAVAGLPPARYGSRGDLTGALKSQGAQSTPDPKAMRTRRAFIGIQAGAAILLLVTAALFLRAAVRAVHTDPGFDAARLIAVEPAFPSSGFDARAAGAYWRSALEQVRAMPSVENAALALYAPFGDSVGLRGVPSRARGGVVYQIYENRTDAAYFSTVGLRVLRGRTYTATDVIDGSRVAVVTESVARDFFEGTDPIGASLSAVAADLSGVTVIGVVREALPGRVRGLGNGAVYRPLLSRDVREARLLVRVAQPAAVARELESVLVSVDSRVRPTTTIVSRDVERAMREPRVLAGLSGAIAMLALSLAVLGVYGVTTFVVTQRIPELQIRRAIGASAPDIVRLLVRQSLNSDPDWPQRRPRHRAGHGPRSGAGPRGRQPLRSGGDHGCDGGVAVGRERGGHAACAARHAARSCGCTPPVVTAPAADEFWIQSRHR